MAEAKRGNMVIKSLGAEGFWKERFRAAQAANVKAFYGIKRCDRFLSVRLESLANLMVLAAAVLSTKVAKNAGYAGWGLSQALSITGLLNWAVRCLTETEQMITSTQRVKEIIDVEPEVDVGVLAPMHEGLLRSGWPWNGAIEFEGVNMRYTEGECRCSGIVWRDFDADSQPVLTSPSARDRLAPCVARL
jgi:ABC-type multidrug transport system fused ATPase/permease subunit